MIVPIKTPDPFFLFLYEHLAIKLDIFFKTRPIRAALV
jgi:hypothetical protein